MSSDLRPRASHGAPAPRPLPQADAAFDRILRIAAQTFDVPAAMFSVVDLERQYFLSRSGTVIAETPYNVAFCALAMQFETPLVVGDARQDPRLQNDPLVTGAPGVRFYAGIRVHNPELMRIGALCVVDVRPRQPSEAVAEQLADLAGLLERELLLRSLSRHDPLTGLHNRTYLEKDLDREWRRARRHNIPLSALLIDVDQLRAFNEIYGYLEGDRALRAIGDQLALVFRRASDILIRLGGDRILILLPDTVAEDALRLAETACREIAALGLGNPAAAPPLTVSIGGATASVESGYADGYGALLREAAEALLAAKHAGGNRVHLGRPPQPLPKAIR